MSDVGGGEGLSWNETSLPVKVVILLIFSFVFGVNFVVWGHIFLSAFISTLCNTSISWPRWPIPATTPARAVTATAVARVTTAPAVTASSPNVRLSAEVLASLPMFSHSTFVEGDKSNLECSVCLMEFEEGEEGRFLPRCLHRFHVVCIDTWFHSHSTCPLCRTVVKVEIV